jgi:hypothetical protein
MCGRSSHSAASLAARVVVGGALEAFLVGGVAGAAAVGALGGAFFVDLGAAEDLVEKSGWFGRLATSALNEASPTPTTPVLRADEAITCRRITEEIILLAQPHFNPNKNLEGIDSVRRG